MNNRAELRKHLAQFSAEYYTTALQRPVKIDEFNEAGLDYAEALYNFARAECLANLARKFPASEQEATRNGTT